MFIDGQLLVEQVRVGTIVADNYSYRGIPFTPTLRAIFPGVSPADVLKALQKSAEALQGGAVTGPPAQPPADSQDDRYAPPPEATTPSQPPGNTPSDTPADSDET
jgi:hypothetical protein